MSRFLEPRLKALGGVVLVLTAIHIANVLLGYSLVGLGILPRVTPSLPHIFTAPLIHGSTAHLFNNLIGLSIFSTLFLLVRPIKQYFQASVFIIFVSGLLVWVFGRPDLHIGASGWVFGLWSLLIVQAWYDKRFINFCIAIGVVFFYGGMIYGVLPTDPRVSFESHLFGALAGAGFAAWIYGAKFKKRKRR